MKIPYCKAKDKDSDRYFEGFYFEYPSTTYCFSERPVELIPCLAIYTMTDWNLPNRPMMVTIDKSTLKLIGYIETDNNTYNTTQYVIPVEDTDVN